MSKPFVFVVLLVLLAGMLASWWLRSESLAEATPTTSAEGVQGDDARPPAEGQTALDDSTSVREPGDASRAALPEGDAETEGVGGRVVLVDDEGTVLEAPTGTLVVWARDDAPGQPIEVPVASGSFGFDWAEHGALYSVEQFVDATQFAIPSTSQEFGTHDRDEVAEVVLVRVPDLELHVRAAGGPAELDGVRVSEVLGEDRYFPTIQATPTLRTLVEDATSPVVLPAIQRRELGLARDAFFLHVEAEGHAPRSLRLDFPGPRTIDVELVPAGVLEVSLSGELPEDGLYLDLTHREAPWTFERVPLHSAGPHRFEALPEGDLLAELFVGRAGSHYDGLEAEWVEIRPGETTFLQLDVVLPEPSTRVAFSGTLEVGAEWGPYDGALEMVFKDVPPDGGSRKATATLEHFGPDGIGSGSFAFTDVVPGPNRFAVPALGWQVILDVPPVGASEVRIEVPSPVEIEIVMVVRGTGEAVQPAFMGASSGPLFDGQGVGANFDVAWEDGVGRVRCALGPVTLTSFAEDYGVLDHDVLVERDGQRFELEVDSHPVLELEFVCNGQAADLPSDARVFLHDAAGESFFRWSSQDENRHRFGIIEGQALTVTFQDFFGYEALEPIVIESPGGEDLARRVVLVRSQ